MRIACLSLFCILVSFSAPGNTQTETCLGCHNFDAEATGHPILESQHKDLTGSCEACHGPSAEHMAKPTLASPDVSFGPRWSASTAEQDGECLACHGDSVGKHWGDALHMLNNISCAACHDVHAGPDKTLNPKTQAEVCTTCHKTQKQGIHGMPRMAKMNPSCTTCHNPHADQSPRPTMLANESAGCQKCHKLSKMETSSKISEKAKSYHRTMTTGKRTCVDCHQGVAHGSTDAEEPFHSLATASREVTLFFPGQSDDEWIRSQHPGSQPFRQGSNCQQCHRGDEADMGAKLLGEKNNGSMATDIRFRVTGDKLVMKASWNGAATDSNIALMWGYGMNEEFKHAGCFAACHEDMPGMSRDRRVGLTKYLADSRSQTREIGRPALVKTDAELAELIAAGNFVELWHLDLQNGGQAQTAIVLDKLDWMATSAVTGSANYADGRWTATISRPMVPPVPLKAISADRRYTFGIAIHAEGREKARHWVSLPMTFSLNESDTDFRAD